MLLRPSRRAIEPKQQSGKWPDRQQSWDLRNRDTTSPKYDIPCHHATCTCSRRSMPSYSSSAAAPFSVSVSEKQSPNSRQSNSEEAAHLLQVQHAQLLVQSGCEIAVRRQASRHQRRSQRPVSAHRQPGLDAGNIHRARCRASCRARRRGRLLRRCFPGSRLNSGGCRVCRRHQRLQRRRRRAEVQRRGGGRGGPCGGRDAAAGVALQ